MLKKVVLVEGWAWGGTLTEGLLWGSCRVKECS